MKQKVGNVLGISTHRRHDEMCRELNTNLKILKGSYLKVDSTTVSVLSLLALLI